MRRPRLRAHGCSTGHTTQAHQVSACRQARPLPGSAERTADLPEALGNPLSLAPRSTSAVAVSLPISKVARVPRHTIPATAIGLGVQPTGLSYSPMVFDTDSSKLNVAWRI
jgi:hypothetical protein